MVGWSKLKPGLSEVSCSSVAHNWTDSCFLAAADLFFASCYGSVGLFTLMYSCEVVSNILKGKNKTNLKDFLRMTLRSTLFGSLTASGTIITSCFFRNLLGKYYYYTLIFIPACVGGFFIFLEARKSREFVTYLFVNCVLEFWIKELEIRKIISWSPNQKTAVFMLLSSAQSYLLNTTRRNQKYFWFFIPPKISDPQKNTCFHEESCCKRNFNYFIKYSTTGLVLQCLRLLVTHYKSPKYLITSILSPQTFKLAAFLGSYVAVFGAMRCFLFQKYKQHSPKHDMIAGFLAGAAYRFQPTLTVLNTSIITIIQILTGMALEGKIIPNAHYTEIIFIISCGCLFHARIFFGDKCPSLLKYMMSAVTHNRADWAAQNYKTLLQSQSSKNLVSSK